uniref:Uncharacterized protein n=1 Tax=Meloidogyne enterolobii TaxID=390850 RepID=A0A6V7U425_MELEN|nr:unnamed protein product [Meloidogyne enterolobii]
MEGRKIDHYIILKEGKKWGGQSLELPENEISSQHNSTASQSDHESSNSVNYGSSPEETFNDENTLPAFFERLNIQSKEKRNKEKRKYMDENILEEQSSRKLCKSSSKLFNSKDCISSSSNEN